MGEFKQNLYDASLDILLTANVPQEIAVAASKIVASDDGDKDNLGRSDQDQEVINEAMRLYHQDCNGKETSK